MLIPCQVNHHLFCPFYLPNKEVRILKGIVYIVTNNINNKQYVGKTTADPVKYWNMHKSRAATGVNKVLYHAMRKYGNDNFDFKIFKEIDFTTLEELNEELNSLEIKTIAKLNTLIPNGYNVTIGGDGAKGAKRDENFRENLRKIKTGVKRPEWVIEKMRKPLTEEHKMKLRKPKSDETKQKLKAVWASFEEKKKQEIFKKAVDSRRGYQGENNPFHGKKHSEEFVKWITEYNTEYQNRDDVKLANKLKQPHRIGVDMIDPETNEVVKSFNGVREAKRWIAENTKYKGDVGTISKAVKSGKLSYGYKWIQTN